MNVELNAFVVIDDWQAVVNRTVANYFDSLGFEHLDQVLDMRVFDLLNMNLLDAVGNYRLPVSQSESEYHSRRGDVLRGNESVLRLHRLEKDSQTA